SEWGHDFRPSYLKIKSLTDLFPETPTIALTASATKEVVKDIVKYLGFENPQIFKKSYTRNNLAYLIFDIEDKLFQVEKILKKINGVIIIYVNTRKRTVDISQQLNSLGYESCFYHGGMDYEEKENAYDLWLSEKKPIIVATNAFGMGIDKPNVRVVIHYDFPKSIENYMQEAGRAGRDGHKSYSVVLKNKTDIDRTRSMFEKTVATVPFIKEVYFKLNQYYRISKGEILEKLFEFNLSEFCEIYHFPMITTFNALSILESEGILIMYENSNRKSTVIFKVQSHVLFDYYERNPSHEKLIKLLLRTYGGIFDNYTNINENHLCSSLGLSQNELTQKLKDLHNDNILSFYNSKVLIHIQFLVPREDDRTINSHSRNIEKRNFLKKEKIDKMIAFIENKNICRNMQLLYYFDESNPKECGICDVCLAKKKQISTDYKKMTADVLKTISLTSEYSSKELVLALDYSEKDILFCLQILLEKNRIRLTLQNKFRLVE
ncbi:MAG: RecQ family ATP-dependent DNA helicase, partial [Flavobacteriaceae bacterium]|nr:RecQ family ATP-dependent DNA helicase [Flavobacteriaceae bacterium]